MGKDETKIIVMIDDNEFSVACGWEHEMIQIDLVKIKDRNVRVGDCTKCPRRYASNISGFGFVNHP